METENFVTCEDCQLYLIAAVLRQDSSMEPSSKAFKLSSWTLFHPVNISKATAKVGKCHF